MAALGLLAGLRLRCRPDHAHLRGKHRRAEASLATLRHVSLHFTARDFANLLTFATAHYGDLIFGIVAALLVADRLERDRRLGMLELQRATDQGTVYYVLGKFLGNYVAVLVPAFLGYLLCALFLVILGLPAVFLQTTPL